jgi:hypothetical protein
MPAGEQAAWLMAQAARAYGGQTPAAPADAGTTGPAELGRDLARLIFGGGPGDPAVPALFSALIARPDSPEALTVLDTRIEEVLEQDAELAAAVDGMLAGFFADRLQSGDSQALAELAHRRRSLAGAAGWSAADGFRCGNLYGAWLPGLRAVATG